MSQRSVEQGFRPPQQARSRESLQKVLAAAERVLADGGIEEFTVGAVADQAGLSVGAIYRRFSGKDQLLYAVKDDLLGRLETTVGDALRSPVPGLHGTVAAFTEALAQTFTRHGRVFPELLDAQRTEGRDRGLQAMATIQRTFVDAAEPCLAEIRRPDRALALRMAARTIIGSCVHRAASGRFWPDDLTWSTWATETGEMALAYLTSPGNPEPGRGD
ncbi:TetR/AcrR family transcriptional regulator [Amycolatopsis carbonis]|uniref:TetR/AcrR family transcriptional regulator n=1 Tax=Amycolatopsis carbonis TaxID=715471 RepID=A0A9Y2ICV8_9PSEU|nr:TetR/AcrR family transcriptional regulator [Amycolatopsis sp. 2-15]WIX77194.1 TetR/AcrR family transcriptional regulator [Amycolatopsis sp. 2-15]